ncbi:MAG: ribonuclease P protein component [Lactobacillales bacterium]|jgi:ribonuclease P protein component|nr:ribonuclease P protein component [Lactobacillales bacterium]
MRKTYRIKKEQEFADLITARDSIANRCFVIYKGDEGLAQHFRVGISVGKKIGKAHTRNKVKRYIRQSLTELSQNIKKDKKFIVIARPGVEELEFAEFKKNLTHALKIAKLLGEK